MSATPPPNKNNSDAPEGASDAEVKASELEFNKVRNERLRMAKEIEELKAEKMKRSLDALAEEKERLEAKSAAAAKPAAPQANDKTAESTLAATPKLREPAPKARLQKRHYLALLSFLLLAVAPTVITATYMWSWAADRYISRSGFSVRTEEVGSAFELLGGVAELSGSSSTDTEILYQFIQSQELVRSIDAEIDLRAIWSRVGADQDPVFTYDAPGTIEDLVEHWSRRVNVYSDGGTGLIDIEVQAFTPEDAQKVNQQIYEKSLEMINRLTEIAREDATSYARQDLNNSVERLKEVRTALTRFRNRTQIVDPAASIQSQMGIMSSLQAKLAEELVELDILLLITSENDPRIVRARQRIDVIEKRIVQERTKFGMGQAEGNEGDKPLFADLVGEYERLAVDLQFAESSYKAAQATLDAALAEARRQSRYLAAHIQPTLPESSEAPDRVQITSLVALFSFLAWAVVLLSAYAIRDRR